MSGFNNACYRVTLKEHICLNGMGDEKREFLYRKFTGSGGDREIEEVVFRRMSESGLGPRLVFSSNEYRIEHFFAGRPLTIWEMKNPTIMKLMAEAIYSFHHTSGVA